MATPTYPLAAPTGHEESRRLDIQHDLFVISQNGALILSDFPPDHGPPDTGTAPLRVLDLGTGNGIWAIEFAKLHPTAEVIGVDLAVPHRQLDDIPENVHFVVQDITQAWPSHQESATAAAFDLIHGRQILLNLPNPAVVLQHSWDALRPGGMIEFCEYWQPMISELACEHDGTPGQPLPLLIEWHQKTVEAAAALGCDSSYAAKLPQGLENAGFEDVKVVDRKIPIGGWNPDGDTPQDNRMAQMDAVLLQMIRFGAPGLTKNIMVKGLEWSVDQANRYAERVVQETQRTDLGVDRIYARLRTVLARKPTNAA